MSVFQRTAYVALTQVILWACVAIVFWDVNWIAGLGQYSILDRLFSLLFWIPSSALIFIVLMLATD